LCAGDRAGGPGQRLGEPPQRPRSPEGVPGNMTTIPAHVAITEAAIGGKALLLLFVWLISGAAGSWLSERKGYGERLGLTLGLLLSALGLLIVLLLPGRPGSKWRVGGGLPRRRRRLGPVGADPGGGPGPAGRGAPPRPAAVRGR